MVDADLRAMRDHCRRMAQEQPEEPLWVQLADEIDARFAASKPVETEELFPL